MELLDLQLFAGSEGGDGIQKDLEVHTQGLPQGTVILTQNFLLLKTILIFILVRMNMLSCQY
jgi:hypothetical protein